MELKMIILVFILKILFVTNFVASTSEVFPEINGLEKDGEVEIYNSDNLYDYINGAADSYLNYDFESLDLQRYRGENDQSLKIEIYKHSNASTGFGIYSSERPAEGNWVKIGDQGYFEKGILNFYKGRYYVKIMTYDIENSKDMLVNTASLVSEKLESGNELLTALEFFPDSGKQANSEKYIHKNFLGYESLSEAFTAGYDVDGEKFTMFLIKKMSNNNCKQMLFNYFNSINLDKEKIKEGGILIKDPYQGEISIIWQNKYVFGVINNSNIELSEKYLRNMSISLNL